MKNFKTDFTNHIRADIPYLILKLSLLERGSLALVQTDHVSKSILALIHEDKGHREWVQLHFSSHSNIINTYQVI